MLQLQAAVERIEAKLHRVESNGQAIMDTQASIVLRLETIERSLQHSFGHQQHQSPVLDQVFEDREMMRQDDEDVQVLLQPSLLRFSDVMEADPIWEDDAEAEKEMDEDQHEEGEEDEAANDWRELVEPFDEQGMLIEFVWHFDLILCF